MNEQTSKITLDLGCGKSKRSGAIGVDYSDRHDADIVHDLNTFPYPFEANEIDEIFMDNVLEHLDDPMAVMAEVHRILKPDGLVKVIVPYFRSVWAFIDPTHRHFFTVDSFAYYDPEHIICQKYDYVDTRFKVAQISFNETYENGWLRNIVVKIANKWPSRYEYYLSHLFPLDEIAYYLRKL